MKSLSPGLRRTWRGFFDARPAELGIKCHRSRRARKMDHERRLSPRFPFIASAELLSESAGTRMTARISDLSATGCYVDTINPLPHGTFVQLKIFTETQHFEAPATVVYAHTHLGMGLLFREVQPDSQSILQNWLPAVV